MNSSTYWANERSVEEFSPMPFCGRLLFWVSSLLNEIRLLIGLVSSNYNVQKKGYFSSISIKQINSLAVEDISFLFPIFASILHLLASSSLQLFSTTMIPLLTPFLASHIKNSSSSSWSSPICEESSPIEPIFYFSSIIWTDKSGISHPGQSPIPKQIDRKHGCIKFWLVLSWSDGWSGRSVISRFSDISPEQQE